MTDKKRPVELVWEESFDRRGFRSWLRLVDCGHWGMILTHELPRWIYPAEWERGIAQIKPVD